ncbi:energy transducer TonB [Gemmatimonadota bacterium]
MSYIRLSLGSLIFVLSIAACAQQLATDQSMQRDAPPPPESSSQESPFFLAWEAPPIVIDKVNPTYPAAALKRGIKGHVILKVYIDETGKVVRAEVVRSIPPGVFDEAAAECVLQWKYQPARQRDIAIPVISTVRVNFGVQK